MQGLDRRHKPAIKDESIAMNRIYKTEHAVLSCKSHVIVITVIMGNTFFELFYQGISKTKTCEDSQEMLQLRSTSLPSHQKKELME